MEGWGVKAAMGAVEAMVADGMAEVQEEVVRVRVAMGAGVLVVWVKARVGEGTAPVGKVKGTGA